MCVVRRHTLVIVVVCVCGEETYTCYSGGVFGVGRHTLVIVVVCVW